MKTGGGQPADALDGGSRSRAEESQAAVETEELAPNVSAEPTSGRAEELIDSPIGDALDFGLYQAPQYPLPSTGLSPSWHQRIRSLPWQAALTVLFLFASGAAILGLGNFYHKQFEDAWWVLALKEAGIVLMVIVVIHFCYETMIHNVLHNDIGRLGLSVEALQRTVAIVGGALESGLGAVYSVRDDANRAIAQHLKRMPKDSSLRLVGISLGAFLCPHGSLHGALRELLSRPDVKVLALILDMGSNAAVERARMEEPHMFATAPADCGGLRDAYTHTRCHNELKTATDFAQDLSNRCCYPGRASRLTDDSPAPAPSEPPVRANFRYGTYRLPPLCYLVIFDDCMFLESYHNAGRGGEAPVLKIMRSDRAAGKPTGLYRIYSQHFEAIWRLSEDPAARARDEEEPGADEGGRGT